MTTRRLRSVVTDTVALRFVEPADAGFILALRRDPALGRNLSATAGGVAEQERWIRAYKAREAAGTEAYFIVVARADGAPVGCVRLYDVGAVAFTWGSWILGPGKPKTAAIETALGVYEVGFNVFGCRESVFDVRLANARTLAFHERFGAERTGEDALNAYFRLDRARYTDVIRPALGAFRVALVFDGDEPASPPD